MPYGRGGAGNFQAQAETTARAAADLEAGNARDEPSQETSYTEKTQQQQYAHTGRGGMGNYYSPKELNETGRWNDVHRSNILGDGTQAPPSQVSREAASEGGGAPPSYSAVRVPVGETASGAVRKVGRGGAGNYMFGGGEGEKEVRQRVEEEEKRREMVKEEVERDVEGQLAVPPKAKLSGGGAWGAE